jgi:tetrahydromethanopterin S-methyltransferase subunit A
MNTLSTTHLDYIFGEICKVLLPIHEETFFGDSNSSVAICTLSSISLLKTIAKSEILPKVAIAGRLFSENDGIDTMIKFVNSNKNIKTIILCGKDVWGHKAGHALLSLYRNGIDPNGKIIGSISPHPILHTSLKDVEQFRNQVHIVNLIGTLDIAKIHEQVILTQ